MISQSSENWPAKCRSSLSHFSEWNNGHRLSAHGDRPEPPTLRECLRLCRLTRSCRK